MTPEHEDQCVVDLQWLIHEFPTVQVPGRDEPRAIRTFLQSLLALIMTAQVTCSPEARMRIERVVATAFVPPGKKAN